jgi:metallo-beta-lactamase family protein
LEGRVDIVRVEFFGGARVVTGSCFLVNTGKRNIMIDCGLFQGTKELKERNYCDFPFDPQEIDCIFLTHAHIDHSGLIPKLCKKGFRGNIYATNATKDLCQIMLQDSGYIQEMEVERKNRKRKRAGEPLLEPIYTSQDGMDAIDQFRVLNYREVYEFDEIKVRLLDAGHILGSSIIEMWVEEGAHWTKLVFTGDLGNTNQPIIRDPWPCEEADYLFIESTYGTREHDHNLDRRSQLLEIIEKTLNSGGNIIIPSFAVGRTQNVIYELNALVGEGRLPDVRVYVDSPLAISATEIFKSNPDCYDANAKALLESGDNPLDFKNLTFTLSVEESKALNEIKSGAIIISASGMCDAGRIKHHLKHNLWREECSVLLIGYQAQGTLGRRLADGEKQVTIHGEKISVNASIYYIEAFSAHADRNGLIHWVGNMNHKPKTIFTVHGEEDVSLAFGEELTNNHGYNVIVPSIGDVVELQERARKVATIPAVYIPYEESIEQMEKAYAQIQQGVDTIATHDSLMEWLSRFNVKLKKLNEDTERKIRKKIANKKGEV